MANKSAAAIWKEYEEYLGIGNEVHEPKQFPSGVTALNYVLSDGGGIPGGTIIQLLGENGHGKSTLALDFLAQAQKSGLEDIRIGNNKIINAAILDFERSFDPEYAETLGIDTSKVLVVRTPFAEQSFTIAEQLLLEGTQFILVDSIGMLVAQDEEDKSYGDSEKVAAEAKALGRFIKRVNAFMDERTLVILINHYRANLSPMARTDKKAYGARIVQYAVKVTLELRRVKQDDDRDHIEVFIQKNKVGGKKGIKVEYQMVSTEGIDYAQHDLDLAVEFGIVRKSGAWYYYGDHKAQGGTNAKKELPMDEIRRKVREYLSTVEDGV